METEIHFPFFSPAVLQQGRTLSPEAGRGLSGREEGAFKKIGKKALTTGAPSGIVVEQNKVGRFRLPHLPPRGAQVNRESTQSGWECVFCLCGYLSKRYPFYLFKIGGAFIIANTAHQINEEIHDKEVRLISAEGEQLGIMSIADALDKAAQAELDLVKISPNAVPPVCKLMDYGKYRFEQTKRDKEAKKNQRIVEIKEVRMSPGIDVNDFNVKVRNAQRFLADGNRVKVAVRFRGREMAHTEIGRNLLIKFAEDCAEVATMDKEPKLDGRHMTMFLSCKQNKDARKKEPKAPKQPKAPQEAPEA